MRQEGRRGDWRREGREWEGEGRKGREWEGRRLEGKERKEKEISFALLCF